MATKHKIVVFTPTNARVIVSRRKSDAGLFSNSLLNPSLSLVKGVPPHFWKRIGNEIHPMTDLEQKKRLADIALYGVINEVPRRTRWSLNMFKSQLFAMSQWVFLAASALFFIGVLKVFYPNLIAFIK